MTLRSVSLLVFFFFVFLFNFYFLLCLFVCLLVLTRVWYFTHKSHNVEFAIFFVFGLFYILFVLYSLSACVSFFVFLFNFYFLLGLFVCLFACFDDSVIFYPQVSQWRSCDFFLFLVCSIFSFGEKKSRSCLSLHSLTTDSNSLY